ncbi:TIGR02391 family protein [Streptosporangium sp. NPDC000563]|uniref:TIGR02391 family protein n=1 Tax=Streptosporangium sp. NPDC000563 TaxID=3154366 RepID=UPI00332B4378
MISLTPQAVLELSVDELALHVLADLVNVEEWNEYNYSLRYVQDTQHGFSQRKETHEAIAEALGWLRAHGMIARTPGNHTDAAIFVTRRGHEALKMTVHDIRAVNRVQDNLHPLIGQKVRRQFLLGEYENAIFVAMKAVEIRVRKVGGFGKEVVGSDLMIKALRQGGPLADPTAPPGEVDGTMMLFRGAYAVLRNPSGHREVSFDDVTEASEAVMTASLLMRMLDRIEQRLTGP